MPYSKYTDYQQEDFLEDDEFVRSVVQPTEASLAFWADVAENHPAKKVMMEEAMLLITTYRRQDYNYGETQKQETWQRIEDSVQNSNNTTKKNIFSIRPWMRVAAAAIIIVSIGLWLLNRSDKNGATEMLAYNTAFGEVKTIELPDHSTVTLNGNSTLSYRRDWKKNALREVWISGEAYFNVEHLNRDTLNIQQSDRFLVHCGDVNIEVLGTTFNVKARHGKTNVALITGKIRIDYAGNTITEKASILKPGDYVEYTGRELVLNKRLLKPAQVATWRSNEITFTDATLKEITETLQDNFGYSITINDSSLLLLKIEGDISVNTVPDLLEVVSTTLDIKIEKTAEKRITISK